jgi:hypothetical protein
VGGALIIYRSTKGCLPSIPGRPAVLDSFREGFRANPWSASSAIRRLHAGIGVCFVCSEAQLSGCLANRQMLIEGRQHPSFPRMLAHDRYQIHQVTLPENLHDPSVGFSGHNVVGE